MAKEWIKAESDEVPDAYGYWQEDAPQEAADYVLKQSTEGLDGRSTWVWIRLPDGDLVLAVYPQGDTYFSTEQWRTI